MNASHFILTLDNSEDYNLPFTIKELIDSLGKAHDTGGGLPLDF